MVMLCGLKTWYLSYPYHTRTITSPISIYLGPPWKGNYSINCLWSQKSREANHPNGPPFYINIPLPYKTIRLKDVQQSQEAAHWQLENKLFQGSPRNVSGALLCYINRIRQNRFFNPHQTNKGNQHNHKDNIIGLIQQSTGRTRLCILLAMRGEFTLARWGNWPPQVFVLWNFKPKQFIIFNHFNFQVLCLSGEKKYLPLL